MKRNVFRYISVCSVIVAAFAFVNYYCYQSALEHFQTMQEDYESRVGEQVQVQVSNAMEKEKAQWESAQTESVQTQQTAKNLSSDAIFQIQSYNVLTQETVTEYQALPDDLAGSSRQEVQKYCREYLNHSTAGEFLDGLQSVSLVSFAADRLVIRKTYDASQVKYRYYLIADDAEVVVYYGDMKTVYERTGISVDALSAKERKALKKGIEVADEEELYGILENYSS